MKRGNDKMKMGSDTMKMEHDSMMMTHSYSLSLPMNRNSSGTAWQPDATPMYGYMKMAGKWNLMFHGSVFLRYNHQGINGEGTRADSLIDRVDAPNWIMIMANRKVKKRGLLALSAMFSADELVMSGNGYPLLFQTGETFEGKPLVDRQHPHDFISGLSAGYTQQLNKNSDATLYVGYPGEPALGSPAFMHRISTFNNPDAPLGHHWQDATHITFGVGTIGFRYKIIKVEGSIFTGREPNENRYDFDKPLFDSHSYRISANPNRYLSMQFSVGFIKSPEALEPDVDIRQETASIIHTKLLGHEKFIVSSLVLAQKHTSEGKKLSSILLESNLKLIPLSIYTRYEFVQKDAHDLQLLQFAENTIYSINAFTLGVNRILLTQLKTDLSIGVQGTINFPNENLKSIYGNNPLSAEVYLKFSPAEHKHH